jgi:hypothetical protein
VFSLTWDWVFWLSLQPQGTRQVEIDWGIADPVRLSKDAHDHPSLYYIPLAFRLNDEDRVRVESVQRGAESGFGRQSPLHPHEGCLWDFVRYLSLRLAGGVGASAGSVVD